MEQGRLLIASTPYCLPCTLRPLTPAPRPIPAPSPPRPLPPQLIHHLRLRQAAYRTTIEQDEATIADPAAGPRPTVAARLLRCEKQILAAALAAARALPGAAEAETRGPLPTAIAME